MATVTTFLEPGTDATQDLSFYISVSGTVASATDQVHTGTSSLKLSTGAGAATADATSPTGVCADAGTQISCYFRFDALPAATASIIRVRTAALAVLNINMATDGKLINAPQGATSATGTTVLAVNTWYRICVSYYITNTTTYQCKVYIDGVLDSTANAGTLTNTGSTLVGFRAANTAGANRNYWIDDLYVATGGASSSSQPDTGDIRVTAKRPNANGTTNNFVTQIGSSGSGYGTGHSPQVNERPLSQTNGWSVVAVGSPVTEEYNIENASTGDVDVSSATLIDYVGWVFTKALTNETAQIIVNNVNANIAVTTAASLFQKVAGSATYPAGTGTDIGMVTDNTVTTVSLYECGIIFAYNPASIVTTTNFLSLLGAGA